MSVDLFTDSSADLSPCRTWRYRLRRQWSDGPAVAFIMLNPSTADEQNDDPTIRRCIGFAKAWGYGSLVVGNLFAFRATEPKQMMRAADPVGPENDAWLRRIAQDVGLGHVVFAWGSHGSYRDRGKAVRALLEGSFPKALKLTSSGEPSHPLYLRADAEPFYLREPAK